MMATSTYHNSSNAVVLVFSSGYEFGRQDGVASFNDGRNLVSWYDTQITAEFKEGTLSGSSGCNSYSGAFQ